MCTVTYLPLSKGYILTSNRDESPARGKAFAPKLYKHEDLSLLYPKDPVADGSWIITNLNYTLCLLNGGFEKHQRKLPYRQSRGVVLIDFFRFSTPGQFFREYCLDNIEPFTLAIVAMDQSKFRIFELVWDGNNKHLRQRDPTKPFILASSTLYDKRMRLDRKNWFHNWLNQKQDAIDQSEIIDFHKNAGNGNPFENLQMNRDEKVKTLSITSVLRNDHKCAMTYIDTEEMSQITSEIPFPIHSEI